MIRQVSLEEISDGKLYTANDMVKADCQGCKGCSSCCEDMGDSIILDPFDVMQIMKATNDTFEQLMNYAIELRMVDGVILPNIKMDPSRNCCTFLNEEGRCSIHKNRPGFCRLFPLGRYYTENGFQYFLQIHECPKSNKTKVKVKKWIGMPEMKKYEAFVLQWHDFLKEAGAYVRSISDPEEQKNTGMYIIMSFYMKEYDSAKDFYEQFYNRLNQAKELLAQ